MQLYCPFCKPINGSLIPVIYGQTTCSVCSEQLGWVQKTGWIDPLFNYNWNNLYSNYDARCKRFNPNDPCLQVFSNKRPGSDRACYNALVALVSNEMTKDRCITLPTYLAITYWKHYSGRAKTKRDVCGKIIGNMGNPNFHNDLAELTNYYSIPLAANEQAIIGYLKKMNGYDMPGIKSFDTIPTRATLLHMVFPDVVPLYDEQVLIAIGIRNDKIHHKDPSRKYSYYQTYTTHIWELVQKYSQVIKGNFTETSLRILDMALWVVR